MSGSEGCAPLSHTSSRFPGRDSLLRRANTFSPRCRGGAWCADCLRGGSLTGDPATTGQLGDHEREGPAPRLSQRPAGACAFLHQARCSGRWHPPTESHAVASHSHGDVSMPQVLVVDGAELEGQLKELGYAGEHAPPLLPLLACLTGRGGFWPLRSALCAASRPAAAPPCVQPQMLVIGRFCRCTCSGGRAACRSGLLAACEAWKPHQESLFVVHAQPRCVPRRGRQRCSCLVFRARRTFSWQR